MAAINNNTGVLVMENAPHERMNDNNLTVASIDNAIRCQGVSEDVFQEALNNSESFSKTVPVQYATTEGNFQQRDAICNDNDVTFVTTDADCSVGAMHLTSNFANTDFHIKTDTNQSVFVPVNNANDNLSHGTSQHGVLFSSTAEQGLLVQNNAESLTSIVQNGLGVGQVHSVIPSIPKQIVQHTAINAPLGSSQNPIRIVQQGNQYTPVQQLSPEQLQQILQVVQQQQLTRNINAGSNVLFNSQTNTKIVYRVVNPAQLHKDRDVHTKGQQTIHLATQKKVYKKKNKDEEQDKLEGPELSKEEKEMRKKMCPKTRSGRVSKPPKHMVKDFKHIHVLDYDEDNDDNSDGGYSDFKYSEVDEEDEGRKDEDDSFTAYGVDSTKPRNWKCITCQKAYIGRAGLGRHLRLNSSHGSLDPDGDGDMEPPPPDLTPATSDEMISNTPATPTSMNSTVNSNASLSEDSWDSCVSPSYTPTSRPRGTGQRGRPRGSRGNLRGRGTYKLDPETRRRSKLKEIIKECTDEELMEIVLPRLAQVITLWEFLLMKVEKGHPAWPHADDVYKEYEKLHQHVKKLCQEYLQYVPEYDQMGQQSLLEINNKNVAAALGLDVGFHKVKDIVDTDSAVQYKYKLLTTNHAVDIEYNNKSILKRTVEVVSPEIIVSPKKIKVPSSKPVVIPKTKHHVDVSSGRLNGESQKCTVANVSSHPSPVLVNNNKTLMSKSKILSNSNVNTDSNTNPGKVSTGRVVSILPTSLSKHSLSSSSLQRSALSQYMPESSSTSILPTSLSKHSSSSLQQSATSQYMPESSSSTQKVIIVSGANNASQLTNIKAHNNSLKFVTYKNIDQTVTENHVNDPHYPVIINEGQSAGSHNQTGVYTVCSIADNFLPVSQAEISTTPSAQSVVLTLPQTSNSQSLQSNMFLNEMNFLNSMSSDSMEISQNASCSNEILNTNHIMSGELLMDGQNLEDSPNYVFTIANGEPLRIAGSENNIVYALSNGSSNGEFRIAATGSENNIVYALSNGNLLQQNLVFAVNSDAMMVNDVKMEHNESFTNGLESDGNANDGYVDGTTVLVTKGGDEIVGVLNSIDTSDSSRIHNKSSPNVDHSIEEQNVGNGDLRTCMEEGNDTNEHFVVESFMNGDTDQSGELSKMETAKDDIGESDDGLSQQFQEYSTTQDDTHLVETLQIPATNIYQTEDGLIFIQNPDGTTLQLQGSDGQAVSLETVQALLGIEGETQITGQ